MENKECSEAILQNLRDAGCCESIIQEFLKYQKCGCSTMQLCVLKKQRKLLLENIHKEQQKLDCLDYLIYKIQGGNHCV